MPKPEVVLRNRLIATAAATLAAGLLSLGAWTTSASAATPTNGQYVVKNGDYLIGIANTLQVKVADLLAANGLTLASVIVPGQALIVPAGGVTPAAPAAAAPAATPAPAASAQTYTVKTGDYLAGIARSVGVTLTDLLAANNLEATSLIMPGQQLALPAGATTAAAPTAAPAAPTTASEQYTVKSGDYLAGIARTLQVSLDELLSVNKLDKTSLITPGQKLAIPASAPAEAIAKANNTAPAVNAQAATVVSYATAQVGKPYKFGHLGPDAFDCSGLTYAAYKQVGISLPMYSGYQAAMGRAIDWRTETIQPGDLIFLFVSGNSDVINHVGIAISSTQWVHATGTGSTVQIGNIPLQSARMAAVKRFV